MNQVVVEVLLILVLLLANGVLAMAEMSLVSSRKARLQSLAEGGSKGARAALELSESPNQFLSTVQIGITLVGILAGAFGGATVAKWLAGQLAGLGLTSTAAENVGLGLVVVAIAYLSLIVGELVPKRIALSAPERFASLLAGPMRMLAIVARPAVKVLGWSTDLVLSVLGAKRDHDSQVTGEEVRLLMQEGRSAGVFHQAEPRMVERVLELDELLVREIMTPRPKVLFLDVDKPHEQIWHKITSSGHSYFPVFQGTHDQVVGVVAVKAFYANLAAGVPVTTRDLMTEALFVPETQSVVRLLESFRQSRKHFAVAADEFGGVVGVVTLVDVLEAIVGDVPTQGGKARPGVLARPDGSWLVDGSLSTDDLEAAVEGLRFPSDAERDYHTVAGFVLEHLGHVPEEGETFQALGWTFEIIDMDRPRIDKILLTKGKDGA